MWTVHFSKNMKWATVPNLKAAAGISDRYDCFLCFYATRCADIFCSTCWSQTVKQIYLIIAHRSCFSLKQLIVGLQSAIFEKSTEILCELESVVLRHDKLTDFRRNTLTNKKQIKNIQQRLRKKHGVLWILLRPASVCSACDSFVFLLIWK